MKKPSWSWVLLGVLVWAVCVGGGVGWLVWAMAGLEHQAVKIKVPGSRTFTIEHPGTYILWKEATASSPLRIFRRGDMIPENMTIVLVPVGSEQPLPRKRGYTVRRLDDNTVRYAVGTYSVPAPGDYELIVAGAVPAQTFAFGPSSLGALGKPILGCVVLNLVGWIGSLVIIGWVFVTRKKVERMPES